MDTLSNPHSHSNEEGSTEAHRSVYSALPTPQSIRILDILPGSSHSIVETTLQVVEFSTAPAYEALSYVWGDPKICTTVRCMGKPVEVTTNLSAALQQLRLTDRVRTFWIDALCINQNDLDERSQQVSFMRDIYSRADNVVIWLGVDDGDAVTVLPIIERIAQHAREQSGSQFPDHSQIVRTVVAPDSKLHEELSQLDRQVRASIFCFYRRSWFSRVWVLQEVAQRKKAIMMAGEQSVAWADVGTSASWILSKSRPYHLTVDETISIAPAVFIYAARNGSRLLTLLQTASNFQATDSRDRVYALLGLATDVENLGEDSLIRPNYQKSVVQTYADVVRYFISLSRQIQDDPMGCLRVLGRNGGEGLRLENGKWIEIADDSDEEGFPSWVPRWDMNLLGSSPLSQCAPSNNWTPSGDSWAEMKLHAEKNSLILKGVRISSLKLVDTSIRGLQEQERSIIMKRLIQRILDNLPNYPSPGSFKSTFAAIITAGHQPKFAERRSFQESDLEAYIQYLEKDIKSEAASEFSDCIRITFSVFITENERVGLGPWKTVVGDEIWLLFGGKVLYVLRPVNGHFKYIGECYVHEYMQGLGFEQWKTGQLKEEWVDLR